MFDYDKWQEILHTIKANKLRTFLTMFGVFWGIFMLMLLLGSGNGLQNGVTKGFAAWASNSGFIWTQKTTMPYKGMKPGRWIQLTTDDSEAILKSVDGLEYLAPRTQLGGWQGGNNITRNNKAGGFNVYGDYPQYIQIQRLDVYSGRFLNDFDIRDSRKVAVIGQNVVDVLFESDEEPIGSHIIINGIYFKVIGTFKSLQSGDQADRDTQAIYIPFTIFQQAFNSGNKVGWYAFSALPGIPVSQVEGKIKELLKKRHKVNPEDNNAIGSANIEEEFNQMMGLFNGIAIFVWIVGTGTLMAGVIGVSNIMLIIVKERTKEIGIRKSMGATPISIVGLILQESVFITLVAGYIGIFLGTVLLETIGYAMTKMGPDSGMFGAPEINLKTALMALAVIIVGGLVAGIIPARKAASVSPIEAIRSE